MKKEDSDNKIRKDEELSAMLKRLTNILEKTDSIDEAVDELKEQIATGTPLSDPIEKEAETEEFKLFDDEPKSADEPLPLEEFKLFDDEPKANDEPLQFEEFKLFDEPVAEDTADEEFKLFDQPVTKEAVEAAEEIADTAEEVVEPEVEAVVAETVEEEIVEAEAEAEAVEDDNVSSEETVTFDRVSVSEEAKRVIEMFKPAFEAPEAEAAEEIGASQETEAVEEKEKAEDEELVPTSKIFDELLACFDKKNIPEDFKASVRMETEIASANGEVENEDVADDTPTVYEQTENEAEDVKEQPVSEFVPIDHQKPTDEDELFSQIFSDEKKEKANKARDKARWQRSADAPASVTRKIFEWLETLVLSAACALLLFSFVFRLAVVDGDSMLNTLHDKETLVISDLMYKPKNDDIIVFNAPRFTTPVVKRVIATAGQTVDIDFETWTVTVDGEKLDEPYVNKIEGVPMDRFDVQFPLTVPEGYVFVLGDNRNNSCDSRDSRLGLVDERFILGRVIVRISPFDKFGKVD